VDDAYRYKAPATWSQEEALKLALRAIDAERQGYDGARLSIDGGLVVIPRRVHHKNQQGEETRKIMLAVMAIGPLTLTEIRRRSKLTNGQVQYQLRRCTRLGLVRRTGMEYELTSDGGKGMA
jgi:hypothetical protein